MSSPDALSGTGERLQRIVRGLIERTEAKSIVWERAALPNSWAVTIALSRFRVHVDEHGLHTLEIFGEGEPFTVTTGVDPRWNALLARLFPVAQQSGTENTADPLRQVEEKLGLS